MTRTDAAINFEMVEELEQMKELDLLNHRVNVDPEQEENKHLSKLADLAYGMNEQDLCVCLGVALEKFPLMVYQTLYYYATRKKGENNGDD